MAEDIQIELYVRHQTQTDPSLFFRFSPILAGDITGQLLEKRGDEDLFVRSFVGIGVSSKSPEFHVENGHKPAS